MTRNRVEIYLPGQPLTYALRRHARVLCIALHDFATGPQEELDELIPEAMDEYLQRFNVKLDDSVIDLRERLLKAKAALQLIMNLK